MEGGASKVSKAMSDDELDSPKHADDNDTVSPSVRSYNCVYCQRGFTTAQALGGHMNIHRRGRGRPPQRNPLLPVVEKTDYYSGGYYGHYSPYLNQGAFYPSPSEAPGNYNSAYSQAPNFLGGATSDDRGGRRRSPEHSLYGEDMQLGLGRHVEDEEEKSQGGEDGLDLELRLGYDP